MTSLLNKDRMLLGIQALRSGEFIQGREALIRSDNGVIKHCCLGVLTEVAIANGCEGIRMTFTGTQPEYEILEVLEPEDGPEYESWEEQSTGGLAAVVAQWYGLKEVRAGCVEYIEDPLLTMENGHDTATAIFLNDYEDGQHNFAYIADAFERTFINA